MSDEKLIHVAMGEVKMARRGETLTALLGSCVAIGVIWPAAGKCALAHCLLPESPDGTVRFGARYVSQAVPSLLALMGVDETERGDVDVVIAGGARMLGYAALANAVGIQNIAAARNLVAAAGLRVVHSDTGGRSGRRIHIDSARTSYSITKILHDTEERHAYA